MIDGRELRFGNLFYWSDPEMDEVKGHKTIGTVWKHNIGDGEFMDAIPLTEEWLVDKIGATELVGMSDGYKRFNLDGIQLSISPERDFFIEYVHKIPMKHLHTFQNFYFATKQKELEVKP